MGIVLTTGITGYKGTGMTVSVGISGQTGKQKASIAPNDWLEWYHWYGLLQGNWYQWLDWLEWLDWLTEGHWLGQSRSAVEKGNLYGNVFLFCHMPFCVLSNSFPPS